MRNLHFGILAALAIAQAGCSSGAPGWVGTWSCSYTDTYTAPFSAGGRSQTTSYTGELAITQASNGDITMTPVVDSGKPCSYVATTSGDTATLKVTQSCDPGTHGGVESLSGDTLTISETFSDVNGDDVTRGTCKRM
jgi:hypothetical protein